MKFRIKFPAKKIEGLSAKYDLNNRYRGGESEIESKIAVDAKKRGFLVKEEFLFVCRWKTPRSAPRCSKNSSEFIRQVTELALAKETCEELRISSLTLLHGVSWPTASVFLHFFHREKYPIIDVRALWSLGIERPRKYTFEIWDGYKDYCRQIALEAGVSMRTLDRALWQYSAENQLSLVGG